ncbi:NAD-dependent succinate-semialdehyde dehydrogenase [Paenactinomyces guangxiensis]|uniref:NAD-dependent succinate-semialdehyde dehydrogenase n=1 Tax=Paenactinomyces guangxiensis TaxID=1490290 RepID=A0A7W1WR88_9BACL|nr:NAD-dependent succinate-semialdehyde dehydrogenase [Paenactinomyces guangxiensis]MBA4494586.1 NAD-dependent succinate-semialdehyde dehydrogenase [Paenactinomyces guangxiensis]MBH8591651.1 NAD-dependent succinate-semialdehyde dehydrogenase [Paenactinomyces guangxiensis]
MSVKKWGNFNRYWINGEKGTLNQTIEVINPATGQVIGKVPCGGEELAHHAVEAAWKAFPDWAGRPAKERSVYLQAWADKILNHRTELAALLSVEQGKPIAEARGEIEGAAEFVAWYAEEAKRVYGEIIPASRPNQRISVLRQPVGVAALITPWNYPAAMVTRKAAPALAAGCTVVLKPAKETPLIAIALFDLLMETGLPGGAANLVTGEASKIGNAWMADERVRKISFTGSTEVGKKLMRRAAYHVKRVSLELGGNAPAIVFADADPDQAAAAIVDNKFENCGQMCNGINLIYAHQEIAQSLSEKIVERARQLKVGDGSEQGTQVGPLINESARKKVDSLVQDAIAKGAQVLLGGHALTDGVYQHGTFYAPTVLTGVDDGMNLTKEEVFGPVAPILSFANEDEVVKRCNQTRYGLAAYLFTRDLGRVHRVSEALEFGMIGVNGTSLSVPQAPFGGMKESGIGREGGHHGLEEFLELKYISMVLN